MNGRTELHCPFVKRKMRRRPSGVARRTGVKIEGAVAEPGKRVVRDDFRSYEGNQPGSRKQGRVQVGQIGSGSGLYDVEERIVPAQYRRHRNVLRFTRQQNDGVEHRIPRLLVAPLAVV